jgi:3-oxoacyl-[acyl-carrier-protein] synthase II
MSAAVTGSALRTPLGNRPDEVARRLLAGERAARPSARFDTSTYACKLGAAIDGQPRTGRERRFLRWLGRFALDAAAEALAASGAQGGERLGLFSAIGCLSASWEDLMPALVEQRPGAGGLWQRGLSRLHPFWMLQHLSNSAHAAASIELRAEGEGATFAGANGSAQALAAALRALDAGAVDVALVMACDSLLEPERLIDLARRGVGAQVELAALAAPYDEHPTGAVPGEAAGALVLERREDAGARARSLIDAAAIADVAPLPSGEPSAHALARAAAAVFDSQAGFDKELVIDGAAAGRAVDDAAERAALATLCGESAQLTATLAAFGHLGAATSLVQAIACAELLRQGALPPIAGLRAPARGPLRPVITAARTSARSWLALSGAAPGLAGAVRVEIP